MNRGVNGKVVTNDEVTSVNDDGHRTLDTIQPTQNYHDVSMHPFRWLEGNNVSMSGSILMEDTYHQLKPNMTLPFLVLIPSEMESISNPLIITQQHQVFSFENVKIRGDWFSG